MQKKKGEQMSKKGNKKDKHDPETIVLVVAIINRISALVDLISNILD